MKYLCIIAAAAFPALACAQATALDGVWKTDPASVDQGSMPSQYLVKDNEYRCESCAPKIRVKADGTPQLLAGNPFIDTLTVRIVDTRVVEIRSRSGPTVSTTAKVTISEDAKSMTREIVTKEANGTTSHVTEKLMRVGMAVRGAHAMTGKWKFSTLDKMSDEIVTFKTAAGAVSMNASDGTGYDARLDGTKAPMRNSPGIDAVSLSPTGKNSWREVSYSGTKPVWVATMSISADGDTMKVSWEDKLRHAKGSYRMVKQ